MIKKINTLLHKLYLFSGYIASFFLILIAILIVLSILTRTFDFYIAGLNEYSGYCLAAASFFGLAYTFEAGGHIRITLFIEKMNKKTKSIFEIWCLTVASIFSGFLSYYLIKMTYTSYLFEERSEGADGILLWPPQITLAIGSFLLFICIIHQFIKRLTNNG